ncbi:MAG: endonuclease/exonuclease/phosphatase family protein, partial [Acidimicrobiales bacterium]
MNVATWNVNSLTARWPRVSAWLEEKHPDVLLIQETKQTDAKFPSQALREIGYESVHYGQGQWNGVAILSRVGLEEVTRGFGDDDPEARFIGARCGALQV